MTLKFDFWRMHDHNGWRLPRAVHHATHLALGLPIALCFWLFGQLARRGVLPNDIDVPLAIGAGVATVLMALENKALWPQWGPGLHVAFRHRPFGTGNTLDFVSDLLLTALGTYAYVWMFAGWRGWLGAIGALLVLGTFNGE